MLSPLVDRAPDATIAWLTKPLNSVETGSSSPINVEREPQPVSVTQFLHHVSRLASALPEHLYAVNLCDNRYLFLVSLCAVIVRGGTNLLPPNKNIATQNGLLNDYQKSVILHDNACEISASGPAVDVGRIDWSLCDNTIETPMVEASHLAAISFTSGSTGQPKPNLKHWRTLVCSSAINARYMMVDQNSCSAHVATVPGQHMWGFETSVLLPLFSEAALVDDRPFFPKDIIDLINAIPMPSTLISAPLHLNSLSKSLGTCQSTLNHLRSILCATAPLDPSLAARLENQTQAELREVYGCSEVGSMAVRRTSHHTEWQAFSGLNFTQSTHENEQTITTVSGDHLPQGVVLEDKLDFSETGFILAGRRTDQIKIAGKRGSLAEVNAVLHRFEGLVDGVVIFPEQHARAVPRLVALVVLQENVTKAQLRAHLTTFLDAAFVPRPIFEVASLPRSENGKLSKAKALDLYQTLTS